MTDLPTREELDRRSLAPVYPIPVDELPTIYELMGHVAREIGTVAKNLKNVEAGYAARSIDDVLDKIHDPLANAGIFLAPKVLRANFRDVFVGRNQTRMREATLRIRWRFYGPRGDYVDAVTQGEALDTGDKAVNKAQSAALKYALLHVFTVPISSGDREADETSPERATEQPDQFVGMTEEQLDTIVELARTYKEQGGQPGRWPVVLGVRLIRGKNMIASRDEAEDVIDQLRDLTRVKTDDAGDEHVTPTPEPHAALCPACGEPINDSNPFHSYPGSDGSMVIGCLACAPMTDDAAATAAEAARGEA
jgi:hypothetical protein